MNVDSAQVSATISATTRESLDHFTEELGLKKNFVIEQALIYFMQAQRDLPDDAFIPIRIILDDDAFDQFVDRLDVSPVPTPALRELMRGSDD